MQRKNYILVLFIVLFSLPSFALKEIVFRNQTQVYADKNENSEVIGVYSRGDSIPISSIKYGAWRKVIVDAGGHKRIGWIKVRDVKGSRIREAEVLKDAHDDMVFANYHQKKYGIGFLGSLSYVYQGSGTIDFDTGITTLSADYSTMKGMNTYFGIFGDYTWSKTTAVRVYLVQRNLERSGTAKILNNPSGSFRIEQQTLSLGANLKWYDAPTGTFWWGPGLEIGKTTKMEIHGTTIAGDVNADATSKPTYIALSVGAGWDFHIGGDFFFLPEFKFAMVPNGSPMIFEGEMLLPVAWAF